MLRLPRVLYEELIAHCKQEYPKEACGILAGKDGAVRHVYPTTNVDASPISYQMDPKEQLQIMKQMRQRNQDMVAIYHSHTASAAYPSPVDVCLAVYPEVSYVLVSLKDRARPEMHSYRIHDGTIIREDLRVEDEPGIMSASPTATVDVRDMLCAQALAVVAQAVERLPINGAATLLYNTADVQRDLILWARDRGFLVDEPTAGALHLQRP